MNWAEQLLGPLAAREMKLEVYRPRHLLLRLLVGGLLAFVLFSDTMGYRVEVSTLPAGELASHYARLTQAFTTNVLVFQLWIVYLVIPIYLCPVFAGEQEATTIALLSASPLSTWSIVVGKIVGRLMSILLLLLLPIPVIALAGFFGGVDYPGLARHAFSLFFSILFMTSLSAFASAARPTVISALMLTFIFIGFLQIIPGNLLWNPYTCVVPFIHLLHSTLANLRIDEGDWFLHRDIDYFLYPLPFASLSLCLFAATLVLVNRQRSLGSRASHVRRLGRWRWVPVDRFLGIFPVENPLWRRARRARVWDGDGLFWSAQVLLILIFAVVLGRQVFLEKYADYVVREQINGIMAALTLSAAYLAAIGLQLDRRSGMLDAALESPLTRWEIAVGYACTVLEHVGPLLFGFFCWETFWQMINAYQKGEPWMRDDALFLRTIGFALCCIGAWLLLGLALRGWPRLALAFGLGSILLSLVVPATLPYATSLLPPTLATWFGLAISCRARTITQAMVHVTSALVIVLFLPSMHFYAMKWEPMWIGFYVVLALVLVIFRRFFPSWGHSLSITVLTLWTCFVTQSFVGVDTLKLLDMNEISLTRALLGASRDEYPAILVIGLYLPVILLLMALTVARFNRWNERVEARGTFGWSNTR